MKYNLAISAIFKNENPYLAEWIEYHRIVGVEHFFLYDNDGGEETQKILKSYVEDGLITLHPWTHFDGTRYDRPTPFYARDKNHLAFAHSAKHHRSKFNWVLKIDIDEFLMPLEGNSVLPILNRYDLEKIKGIEIPRIDFGSSGHRKRPEGLVLESYLQRESAISDHKDLANSSFLSDNRHTGSAHRWGYRWFRGGKFIRRTQVDGLRINHYYSKSLEDSLKRQNMMRTRPTNESEFFNQDKLLNEVRDESTLRFVPAIRKSLSERAKRNPK